MDLTHPSHTSMDNTLRGLSRKLDAYLKLKSSPPLSSPRTSGGGGRANIQPQHFGRQQDGGTAGWMDGWMCLRPTCPQVEGETGFNKIRGVAFGAESPDRSAVCAAVRSGRHQFGTSVRGMSAGRLGRGEGGRGGGGRRSRTTATHSHTEGER